MVRLQNSYGLRVLWLDGHRSDHWFNTPQQQRFMLSAFNRMCAAGWDDGAGEPQVDRVLPISLNLNSIGRSGAEEDLGNAHLFLDPP